MPLQETVRVGCLRPPPRLYRTLGPRIPGHSRGRGGLPLLATPFKPRARSEPLPTFVAFSSLSPARSPSHRLRNSETHHLRHSRAPQPSTPIHSRPPLAFSSRSMRCATAPPAGVSTASVKGAASGPGGSASAPSRRAGAVSAGERCRRSFFRPVLSRPCSPPPYACLLINATPPPPSRAHAQRESGVATNQGATPPSPMLVHMLVSRNSAAVDVAAALQMSTLSNGGGAGAGLGPRLVAHEAQRGVAKLHVPPRPGQPHECHSDFGVPR